MHKEQLPFEFETQTAILQEALVEAERSVYHSDIVPFQQHEGQLRECIEQAMHEYVEELSYGCTLFMSLCKRESLREGRKADDLSKEAWEHASQLLKKVLDGNAILFNSVHQTKPLQEHLGIDTRVMEQGYDEAISFLREKKFYEAKCLFFFLCHLQPLVFEYWFGIGAAMQELARYEEAVRYYSCALVFNVQKAAVFFQMGNCYMQLGEKQSARKAFGYCMQYAKENAACDAMAQEAQQLIDTIRE
jgi:type III secretion system low calcium response chaperone LcrH/SycD